MSGSLLESARSALEEIEALEVLAVDTLGQKPSGAKASMEQQGTLKNVVEGMTAAASHASVTNLHPIYTAPYVVRSIYAIYTAASHACGGCCY